MSFKLIARTCPICHSVSSTQIFHDHNRREGYIELEADFVRCNDCGMEYLTNVPDFQDFAGKYEEIFVEPNIEKLHSQLSKNPISNAKKVLDIGCNHGGELMTHYNAGWSVYGIDLNPKAIETCKKYLPKDNFFLSTIEQVTFPDETFDRIITSHVLEHVYDVDAFLAASCRLLKKGGELIIRVPNGKSLDMIVNQRYSAQMWIPFHINLFSPKLLSRKVSEHEFNEIQVKTNTIAWYWILSFRQRIGTINTSLGVTNFTEGILSRGFRLLITPFTYFVARLGYGEEIYLVAKK